MSIDQSADHSTQGASPRDQLRSLPSVNELLFGAEELVSVEGHTRVVTALRQSLEQARVAIRVGLPAPTREELIEQARRKLQADTPGVPGALSAVINATGIVVHTNLGRAVLSQAAQQAMLAVASGYSPLEFDLGSGERGRRGQSAEHLLCQATGAEAALVVNNCAAATVLMLSAIAQEKGVVISRGQLVEIGGGFRIPDILQQSRARLLEVGTTNRTRRSDYEQALRDHTDVGAILRVHSSNFRVVGFTESVGIDELVEIGRGTKNEGPKTDDEGAHSHHRASSSIPVLDDVGSGALLDTAPFGLTHEPMPQESVRAGADVVTFSGDKLLGGPQAGILVGKRDMIERCRRHPLARAFRADKFMLAALSATVLHYLRNEAVREVPVWRMISLSHEEIHCRAQAMLAALGSWCATQGLQAEIIAGESAVGGGSLPGETLPTALIALRSAQPDELAKRLRMAATPIIARIRDDLVLLDLRTVLDDDALMTAIQTVRV